MITEKLHKGQTILTNTENGKIGMIWHSRVSHAWFITVLTPTSEVGVMAERKGKYDEHKGYTYQDAFNFVMKQLGA